MNFVVVSSVGIKRVVCFPENGQILTYLTFFAVWRVLAHPAVKAIFMFGKIFTDIWAALYENVSSGIRGQWRSRLSLPESFPVSIFYKSTAGRYRPVSYPDGPIKARCRFIKNANWVGYYRMYRWKQIPGWDCTCAGWCESAHFCLKTLFFAWGSPYIANGI